MRIQDIKIVVWAIERLIPHARNARLHSEVQVAQIAASIAEFGFNNPILVGPQGDIIAGHARVLAARKLAYTLVPVIVLDHLTENQKRAFMLADNKLALNAGWDLEMLRLELEALAEENFDLALTGFDERNWRRCWRKKRRRDCPIQTQFRNCKANRSVAPERFGYWAGTVFCAETEPVAKTWRRCSRVSRAI